MKRLIFLAALLLGLLSVAPARAASLSELFFYNNPAAGGNTIKAQVNLGATATEAVTVSLTSANPSVASVPASVTVASGKSYGQFSITTSAVSAQVKVAITATLGATSVSREVTINPASLLAVLAPSKIVGGYGATGTIKLSGLAPEGGHTVSLASSSDLVGVPSSVTVPAGQQTATFAITSQVTASTVKVTFTAADSERTVSKKVSLVPVTLASVSLKKVTVTGAATVTGTVKLNAIALEAVVVTLESSSSSVVVPESVTVPVGASSATFTVQVSAVDAKTKVTITARNGSVSKTAKMTLVPVA